MTDAEVQQHFDGGPRISKSAVLVLLGDRIYQREGSVWRLLDNRAYRDLKEMTGEP